MTSQRHNSWRTSRGRNEGAGIALPEALVLSLCVLAGLLVGGAVVYRHVRPPPPLNVLSLYAVNEPPVSICEIDMASIATAVRIYKADNGRLPLNVGSFTGEVDNRELMLVLRGQASNAQSAPSAHSRKGFLVISARSLKDGRFVDPWGHPYHIAFARGGSKVINFPTYIVNDFVAVWSDGANGVNDFGQGDDPHSWSEAKH